jgi:hypothetical protein
MNWRLLYSTTMSSTRKKIPFLFYYLLYTNESEFSSAWMTSYKNRTTKLTRADKYWVSEWLVFSPFLWENGIGCELILLWERVQWKILATQVFIWQSSNQIMDNTIHRLGLIVCHIQWIRKELDYDDEQLVLHNSVTIADNNCLL